MVTRIVVQITNTRLWHKNGYAQSQLWEKQEALRYYNLALPLPLYEQVGDKEGEATTLNNLLPLPIRFVAKVALRCKICYKG